MSRDTLAHTNVLKASPNVLDEVYRRVAQVHATLAEADRVDEDLHRRTLDWLMDVLEVIEAVPPAPPAPSGG